MKWFISLLITFLLVSCASFPIMHYATAQNVPLFSQKNDFRVSVATGSEKFGIQGAYAFSNSLAVLGSYSYGMNDVFLYTDNLNINNGNRWNSEFAFGYFYAIDPYVSLELYGGAERYHRDYSVENLSGYEVPNSIFSTNFTKLFVQFDLGFPNEGNHCLGISAKFGYLIYDHYSLMVNTGQNYWIPYTNYVNNATIFEPCITYRLGGRRLSFQAQIGYSFTKSEKYALYVGGNSSDYPFFVNVGLTLRLFNHKEE